jgi:large subunit ribosomal protein L15
MDLGNLSPAKGSVRDRKRIGRGNATGQGRTAGKGNNGYKSRSGASSRLHFEGGQTPLMRRLPKRGFSNYPFKKIDVNILIEHGVVKKAYQAVKILSEGEITTAIDISADMFSKLAVKKIENAGGKVTYL